MSNKEMAELLFPNIKLTVADLEKKYQGLGYGDFKKSVADVVCNNLKELQDKVKHIQESGILDQILEDGAKKASYLASKKLSKVYRKIGLRANK